MTRLISVFVVVSVLAGCAGTEQASSPDEADRAIAAHMRDRYDLTAVSAFIRDVIREHPTFEGVDLSSTLVENDWKRERIAPGSRMRSGDWVLYDVEQGDDRFDLYFMYDPKAGRCVTVQAKRLSKDHFQFVGLVLAEWVELSDVKKRANQTSEGNRQGESEGGD